MITKTNADECLDWSVEFEKVALEHEKYGNIAIAIKYMKIAKILIQEAGRHLNGA